MITSDSSEGLTLTLKGQSTTSDSTETILDQLSIKNHTFELKLGLKYLLYTQLVIIETLVLF